MVPLAAVDSRIQLLLIGSPPRDALLHRDNTAAPNAHLGTEYLMKHMYFILFFSVVFNAHVLFVSHLAWQQNKSALKLGGDGESHLANCVSHDQSHGAHMHANSCLFICSHDSAAISCLVAVSTCQMLWEISQNSWPVHQFFYITEMGLQGAVQLSLMSSFHLTFSPPVALDPFMFGSYASSSQAE